MRGLMAVAFASCMMAAPAMGAQIVRIEEDDPPSPDDFRPARRTDRVQGREIARTQTREQERRLRQAARREARRGGSG